MAANPSVEAEVHAALREELGAIRGILAIPEVQDAVQRVRKGKQEEVVAGPMLPPSYGEGLVIEGEGSEHPRRRAERLARTYATPE